MCGKDDAALGAQGRATVDRNAFAFVQALAQPGGGQAVAINAGFVTSEDSSGSNRFVAGGYYPKSADVRTSASAGQLKYSTMMCRSNGGAGLPFRAASMTRRQTSTVA